MSKLFLVLLGFCLLILLTSCGEEQILFGAVSDIKTDDILTTINSGKHSIKITQPRIFKGLGDESVSTVKSAQGVTTSYKVEKKTISTSNQERNLKYVLEYDGKLIKLNQSMHNGFIRLGDSGYDFIPSYICKFYRKDGTHIEAIKYSGTPKISKGKITIDLDVKYPKAPWHSAVCTDPLVNGSHPVIGYVTIDGNTDHEYTAFMNNLSDNDIRNFSWYSGIPADGFVASTYDSSVDVYLVGGPYCAQTRADFEKLNESSKPMALHCSGVIMIEAGICAGMDSWEGTGPYFKNVSGPVWNATNGFVTGVNVLYSSFRNGPGCNSTFYGDIHKSMFAANDSIDNEYSGLAIENDTQLNWGKTQNRWLMPVTPDGQHDKYNSRAWNSTIQQFVWLIGLGGGSAPTAPTAIHCDGSTDCNKSASTTEINATGSSDRESDVITYFCEIAENETLTAGTAFDEDGESGMGNWHSTLYSGDGSDPERWNLTEDGNYSSPTHSFWANDWGTTTANVAQLLWTENITIPNGAVSPQLSFWLRVETENNCDGCWLEYSIDGAAWTLAATGDLTTSYTGVTGSNCAYGVHAAWEGSLGDVGRVNYTIPDSAIGHDISFKWVNDMDNNYDSDGAGETLADGCWIDEINVTYDGSEYQNWTEIGNHTSGNSITFNTEGEYTGVRCRARDLDGSNTYSDYYTNDDISLNITVAGDAANISVSIHVLDSSFTHVEVIR